MGDSTLGGIFPSGIGANLQSLNPFSSSAPAAGDTASGAAAQGAADIQGAGPSGMGPGTSPLSGGSSGGGSGIAGLGLSLPQLVSGGGMLANLIKGPGTVPQKGNIESIAGSEMTQGNQLVGDLASGQLPPGEADAINQQLQAQIANIQQKYAQMGLSGSTMEQQDIANAQQQAVAQTAAQANQATQTGLQLLGAADSAYGQLGKSQVALDNQLSQSLADMMEAFGGGTGATKQQYQNPVAS